MNIQLYKLPPQTTCVAATALAARSPRHPAHNPSSNDAMEISMNTNIRKVMIPALLSLSVAIAGLTSIRAHAGDSSPSSVRVSIAGFDRNSVEGARKIYARLKAAAYSVCGESEWDHYSVFRHGPSDCVNEALARAVLDVRSTQLSNLFIQKNGVTVAAQYGITPDIMTASK